LVLIASVLLNLSSLFRLSSSEIHAKMLFSAYLLHSWSNSRNAKFQERPVKKVHRMMSRVISVVACFHSCKSGFFDSGQVSGLNLSKCFGTISSLHRKPFDNIQIVTIFLSWPTFVVLIGVTSVMEIIDFSSANCTAFANSCVLLFSARISLALFLRRRQLWGNQHMMALLRKDRWRTRFVLCF